MNSDSRTARTLSRAGAVVALALLAGGCSPPELPLVAVGKGPDGDVRALLRPCSDDALREVVLLRIDEKGDEADPAALDHWSARPPGTATGEQELSLFRLPKGWHGKAGSATKLAPGRDYSMWFVVGPDDTVRYKGTVDFTRADVEGLAPGRWWADGKAMSRTEFRARADDAC
ncbi:hypothetical protein GTY65_20120 [Streptomyces sp. SID8379]|uniref:hypothetical protein n=1 Tax=unclassified Streptomyces TaxID=2593676 RepID=UPI00037C8EDB|nr:MULTISPECIES: hypothetical protein [unclassified Streptomyces]MYW66343.1 hypothetical protein [Streptomyces sp. SID8379]